MQYSTTINPVQTGYSLEKFPIPHSRCDLPVSPSTFLESGDISAAESVGCPTHQRCPIETQREDGHCQRHEQASVDGGHRQRPLVDGILEIHRLDDSRIIEK